MFIAGVQFDLAEESLDIYFSGCVDHCTGCHNKELWKFNIGKPYKEVLPFIEKTLRLSDYSASAGGLAIRYIRFLGGEPTVQDVDDMEDFINYLEFNFTKELCLYTRYSLEEIDPKFRRRFSYIKTGPYDDKVKEYKTEYGFKVLSNQKINKRGIDY